MGQYSLSGSSSDVQRAGEASMIGAIARWCECLHGQSSIFEALEQISESIEAEAILLSRLPRGKGGQSCLLPWDAQFPRSSPYALNRSYARSVLGAFYDKPKPGSIWIKSAIEPEPDPSLIAFHQHRKMSELVIIPLSVNEKSIDCLELHFSRPLNSAQHALFNMIGSTLTQTWGNRSPGFFTENVLRMDNLLRDQVPLVPILSMENPARLSRSEYRVCLLLSRGKSVKRVESELAICTSTVRTHLRNIYAKTNTANLAELMYHLLTLARMKTDAPSIGNMA